METKLRKMLEGVVARMFIYEKCHQETDLGSAADMFAEIYVVQRPDPSFVARGDECSAYLTHITQRYVDSFLI